MRIMLAMRLVVSALAEAVLAGTRRRHKLLNLPDLGAAIAGDARGRGAEIHSVYRMRDERKSFQGTAKSCHKQAQSKQIEQAWWERYGVLRMVIS